MMFGAPRLRCVMCRGPADMVYRGDSVCSHCFEHRERWTEKPDLQTKPAIGRIPSGKTLHDL